ncbi:hypothetical protein F7R02_23935 [Xanthomonas cissicola]|nr:hypothetical protein F7R02_23935 [Xanthomonas cissicola]
MDEAKAVAAGYGERAPVNQEIPTESARNGEIPKIQTPLFGTTRHPALSGLVIQTFLRRGHAAVQAENVFLNAALAGRNWRLVSSCASRVGLFILAHTIERRMVRP